jgi:co-chaperonin GroES (HSP10)
MIRVTGDRVLVALPPKEHVQEATTGYTYQEGHTTGSGLVLAKPADVYNVDLATRGIVVALGEKRGQVDLDDVRAEINEYFIAKAVATDTNVSLRQDVWCDLDRLLMQMAPAPFDVQPGDCVLFSPSAGDQISFDGTDYVILHEGEIIGVVDPKE